MPRRGRRRGRRGDGSIVLVGGRYQARYSSTEGGVRKRKSKTFDLRNDAEWWLRQAQRSGEAPDDLSLRAYLARWLSGKRAVAPTTRVLYANHVDHISAVLGGYRLVELQRRHIEAFVDDTWMEHVVRVLLGSGMRVGEAVALNQGDVHDGLRT